MPQIPIYNQRKVAEATLPGYRQGLRADPKAFGAGLSKGIADLGQGVESAVQKYQDDNDRAVLMEAEFRAMQAREAREQELKQQRGQDAVGHSLKAPDDFGKDMEDIAATLSNDRQKAAFEQIWSKNLQGFQRTVNGHTNREADAVAESSYRGIREMTTQRAAAAAAEGDMGTLLESREELVSAVNMYADRHGLDGSARKAELREATTAYHTSALATFLEGDDWKGAKNYLKHNRDEIDPGALKGINNKIKLQRTQERASTMVDSLARKHSSDQFDINMTTANRELADMRATVDDPELLAAVEDRLEQVARQRKQSRIDWDGERLAQLEVGLRSREIRRVTSSPLFDEMSSHGQARALRFQDAHRRGRKKGDGQASRDRELEYAYKALPRSERLETDVFEFAEAGSPEVRQKLAAYKTGLREKSGEREADFRRNVALMMQRNGFVGKPGSRARQKGVDFKGYMQDKWEQWEKDNPDAGNPPPELIDEWETRSFDDLEIDSWLPWTVTKKRYELGVNPGVEEGGDVIVPEHVPEPDEEPLPKGATLRWPKSKRTAKTIDDVPTSAVAEAILPLWRKERGPDSYPNEKQIVAAFNAMQVQR